MKRTFTIFTEPHVADPAHLCPIIETTEGNEIMYSDLNPLKDLIDEMEFKSAYNTGWAECENKLWDKLGIKNPLELEELVEIVKNIKNISKKS